MIVKIAEIEKQELTAETRRRGEDRTSRTTGTEMQPQISQINADRKIMQSKGSSSIHPYADDRLFLCPFWEMLGGDETLWVIWSGPLKSNYTDARKS
jgi:hypothetical protein